MSQTDFWRKRARQYNRLNWVNDRKYLKAILRSGNFGKKDIILDVGFGTGTLANYLAPKVKGIIGLDFSKDMLKKFKPKRNICPILGDIRKMPFEDNVFDKIIARMVFHHILTGTQKSVNECHRVLKKGGKLIIAETVAPSTKTKSEFAKMARMKERRHVFIEKDLVLLMKKAGFRKIKVHVHIIKGFSVKNWLINSGTLSNKKRKAIFEFNLNASRKYKKVFNMKITKDDCLIDLKNAIVVGEK